MTNVKLSKSIYGANIIVGISSNSKEDITYCFNHIYNLNGCPSNTELEWINEIPPKYFAKFQTGERRFLECLSNQYIFNILKDNPEKEETTKIRAEGASYAFSIYQQMEYDLFLTNRSHIVNNEWVGMGKKLTNKSPRNILTL